MLVPFHIKKTQSVETGSIPPSPTASPSASPAVSDKKTPCVKLLHDYIKCIYDDEKCCAELYQRYLTCDKNEKK